MMQKRVIGNSQHEFITDRFFCVGRFTLVETWLHLGIGGAVVDNVFLGLNKAFVVRWLCQVAK